MRLLMLPCLPAMLTAFVAHPASSDVLIGIDKASQRMVVSVNGQPRYTWPVSTGAAGYDTPSGSFRPLRMARTHFSREWDNAPMPYAIFFTPDGHAIHGTNHGRQLGRPASHGCVRLAPRHAAALFALVQVEGVASTQVVVEGPDESTLAYRGSGPGVNPLEVLQRSAPARSKWRVEPAALSGQTTPPLPISPAGPSRTASGAFGSDVPALSAGQGGVGTPEAAASSINKDAVLSRLMSDGTRASKPICSGC
ncbi:L,D-transpeptidase [Methylobacterium gregans]|uniref:L,D-transpeptidase n=1 Tax=Methylobacterium gregans TaxID=374424 RepID=UPI001EE1FD2D|nr:L,D-transpeptidase [Methylobacterium gregans]MDQ0518896.1 hypothetical protein [Methylobacterium gregans]